jgi:flagellar protein FliO/FliZ
MKEKAMDRPASSPFSLLSGSAILLASRWSPTSPSAIFRVHASPAASQIVTRCRQASRAIVAVLFCSAARLVAADDNKIIFPSGAPHAAAPSTSAGGAVSTMTLVLALALAAVGGWMVWRNRRGPGAARESRNLAVEETRSLGNRQYLVVASYEGKKFLLGVCPGRIDMLAPLNERKGAGDSE